MRFYAKTHIGKVRKSNQDAYLIVPESKLMAVADGMGGHLAGDIASAMAIDILKEYVIKHQGIPEEILFEAFNEANFRIYEKARTDSKYFNMGTTLTAAMITDNRLVIGHVGDSRAYLLQENEFFQLTNDHSFVGELLRNGNITSNEANSHPQKNMLVRALGMSATVDVDIRLFEVEKGSKILISSDGLTNMLLKEEIKEILSTVEPQYAVEQLVEIALDRGGTDNITAVLGVVGGDA